MPSMRNVCAAGLAAVGVVAAAMPIGVAQTSASSVAATGRHAAPWAQSAWVKGYNSTVRLIAGAEPADLPGGRRLVAGVEIRLNDGWKTYWRHPGDDGGMPPSLDWSASRNLKAARLGFPAPERLKSVGGTSIGYTKAVVLPVEIEPADPASPVELVLALEYGICREICVPAEAKLQLTVAPMLAAMPPGLATAMARVPRAIGEGGGANAGQSPLRSAKAVLGGSAPAITFDIATGADGARADLFVEPPDGLYLPVATRIGEPAAGVQRFRIDLKGVEDVARLGGKRLRLTVTGASGGVELGWVVK